MEADFTRPYLEPSRLNESMPSKPGSMVDLFQVAVVLHCTVRCARVECRLNIGWVWTPCGFGLRFCLHFWRVLLILPSRLMRVPEARIGVPSSVFRNQVPATCPSSHRMYRITRLNEHVGLGMWELCVGIRPDYVPVPPVRSMSMFLLYSAREPCVGSNDAPSLFDYV